MTPQQMIFLLNNSGLNVLGTDGAFIFITDPTCFTAGIMQMLSYAWVAIAIVTGFLLMGWAFAMFRGGTQLAVMATNLRNLLIVFMTLSITGPIVNAIYGDDLWYLGCDIIGVPVNQVQELLLMHDRRLADFDPFALHEHIHIWDSAVRTDTFIPPDITGIEPGRDGTIIIPGRGGWGQHRGGRDTRARDILRGGQHVDIGGQMLLTENDRRQFREVFAASGWGVRQDAGALGAARIVRDAQGREVRVRDHQGRDFYAPPGAAVPAFWHGRIVDTGRIGDHGLRSVTIRKANGVLVFMGYVETHLNIGDPVSPHQVIGRVQNLHINPNYARARVPNHVHFEIWQYRGTLGQSRTSDGIVIDAAELL